MKPEVHIISQISSNQSVICLLGSDSIPDMLKLSIAEKEFANKQLLAKEKIVIINSYNRFIYLVRLKEEVSHYKIREELRKNAYDLRTRIKGNNHSELVITSDNTYKGAIEDFTEGFLLSIYSFDKYKTTEEENDKLKYPSEILLSGNTDDAAINWLIYLTDAVYFTRDLINEPVNYLNATALANEIRRIGESAGFTVEVLAKSKIEALKMGGLLAVNRGSIDPPTFCIMEWHPDNCFNKKPIILVGKGVVYDTGGLNIKTGNYMEGMKGDMAGAAIVTGVIYTAAKARIPLHIVGLVPSTDNRPGGNAYTQGDIIPCIIN